MSLLLYVLPKPVISICIYFSKCTAALEQLVKQENLLTLVHVKSLGFPNNIRGLTFVSKQAQNSPSMSNHVTNTSQKLKTQICVSLYFCCCFSLGVEHFIP